MRRTYASRWDNLGRQNAFGAILTVDGELTAWDPAQFFATGAADAQSFVERLTSIHTASPRTRALDFGCGVGRVTRGLAEYFDEVVGVDVAPSMIERARTLNVNARCSFLVNNARTLDQFPDASFTVVYSRLVLQHVRPSLVRRYIPELIRVLAPGGALMFQLPDIVRPVPPPGHRLTLRDRVKRYLPWPLVVTWRRIKCRLASTDRAAQMTMYGMAPEEVLGLIRLARGRVLDILGDTSHGADVDGFEYWVTKDEQS